MSDESEIGKEHFESYSGAGVVSIRSLTNVVWCADDSQLHRMITDSTDPVESLSAADAEHPAGAPHRIESMPYPFPGSGVAVDTAAGRFAIGTLLETTEDLEALLRDQRPVPWFISLPGAEPYLTTVDPRTIQALFVAFTGLRTFGEMTATVDAAYAKIAEWEAEQQ